MSDTENTETENTETAAPEEAQLGDAGRRALEAERKARRNAEQQLGQLGQRVEALQRAEVERIAAADADGYKPLADGRDVWKADDVDLSGLLGEDGAVDPEKVRETVGGVIESRPHWAKSTPRVAGSADARRGGPATGTDVDEIAARLISGE